MEDTVKKFYYLQGIQNNYSASLTYPEDFDEVGLYTDLKDAQDEAKRRNELAGHTYDEEYDEWDRVDDEYFYEVTELRVVK